jgi:uncharacterized protein (DUF302 family)
MSRLALAALALASLPLVAHAEGFITRGVDGSFDDTAFAIESAIVGKGLVIDSVSHVGEMLERTKADVGSEVTVFNAANVYLFCSATVSRKVMEADPMNIQYCPYGITVMEDASGAVSVGYRDYPEGAMQEVEDLLKSIVDAAVGG